MSLLYRTQSANLLTVSYMRGTLVDKGLIISHLLFFLISLDAKSCLSEVSHTVI